VIKDFIDSRGNKPYEQLEGFGYGVLGRLN